MKQRPKSLSSVLGSNNVDRKLACGVLAFALMGGTGMTAHAADSIRGGYLAAPQANSNKHTVSGVVVDESGEPMIGVSVIQEGTTTGIATDFDGRYTLTVPAGAVLNFSYIGYKSQSVKVGNQTTIDITMQPDTEVLDDVVVIGYGTVKKNDLTGSVSSVDTKALHAKGAPLGSSGCKPRCEHRAEHRPCQRQLRHPDPR